MKYVNGANAKSIPTFDNFDWTTDDLVSIDLLLDWRCVDIFSVIAWELQRTLRKLSTWRLITVHCQIVLLTMSLRTLHLILSDVKKY